MATMEKQELSYLEKKLMRFIKEHPSVGYLEYMRIYNNSESKITEEMYENLIQLLLREQEEKDAIGIPSHGRRLTGVIGKTKEGKIVVTPQIDKDPIDKPTNDKEGADNFDEPSRIDVSSSETLELKTQTEDTVIPTSSKKAKAKAKPSTTKKSPAKAPVAKATVKKAIKAKPTPVKKAVKMAEKRNDLTKISEIMTKNPSIKYEDALKASGLKDWSKASFYQLKNRLNLTGSGGAGRTRSPESEKLFNLLVSDPSLTYKKYVAKFGDAIVAAKFNNIKQAVKKGGGAGAGKSKGIRVAVGRMGRPKAAKGHAKGVATVGNTYTVIDTIDTSKWPDTGEGFFEDHILPLLQKHLPNGESLEVVHMQRPARIELHTAQ